MKNYSPYVRLQDGSMVEGDVYNIVSRINSRWPELSVQYLNPDHPENLGDAPYRIVEHCKDGHVREVMRVWQLDHSVIKRLELADSHAVDTELILDRLVEEEKRKTRAKYEAQREEAKDLVSTALASRKQTFKFKKEDGRLVAIKKD